MEVAIDRGDADHAVPTNSATHRRGLYLATRAAILLVIALSATALLQTQHDTKTLVLDRIYTARYALSSQSTVVLGWVNRLPQVIDTRRTLFLKAVSSPLTSSTKGAVGRAKAVTAEGADMAWEKSESLLRELHPGRDDSKKRGGAEDNVLQRALEGLQGIFNRNKKEGGQKHVMADTKKVQIQKRDKKEGHRLLKATDDAEQQTPSNQDVGGFFFDALSTVSSSPIAAAILIVCGFAFLIISVAMSPDSRRLRRLADSHENRTIVLDEDEAEIVEFYEKEMESGMMQSIPFLEDDSQTDECREDEDDEEKKRGQSFIRSPSSDSSLNRHLSGEARVSQCDSYYSRVLQDISSFDELDNDQEDEEDCANECGEKRRQEGESSPRDDADEVMAETDAEEVIAETDAGLVKEDDRMQPPTQEHNINKDADRPSSPPSSRSSISSLTSEVYADIESPPPQPHEMVDLFSNSNVTSPALTIPRRSVSFSPDVKVREIPRHFNSEMSSSEKYLYLMLFTVAIIIAFCSLLPAPHPSLSVPISHMTAGEMIQRADTMLKSQWEVEL